MDVAVESEEYHSARKEEPLTKQRIFVTFHPEQEQSTALFTAQGKASTTQSNLNLSMYVESVQTHNLYYLTLIEWYYKYLQFLHVD